MTRVKRGYSRRKKCKKILQLNKGFRHPAATLFSIAKQKYINSHYSAFCHRQKKNTVVRQIWIKRINALARKNAIKYSQIIHLFRKSNILLNRKMISQLYCIDPITFSQYLKTYFLV